MTSLNLPQETLIALANSSLHDRIVGSLFGSALGDAIGLYTEFISAANSAIAYPSRKFTLSPSSQTTPFRRDAHRGPHKPGDWTDDTDHAMLILLSYLHHDGGLDPQDFASRLRIWVQMGLRALDTLPLGLGRTVGAIVRSKNFLDDPEGSARVHWAKGGYQVAPNGSLMRTHPLGLMCLSKSLEETFQVAADFSVVTHVDPRCVVSCAIGTALVRGVVRQELSKEEDMDDIIEKGLAWYAGYRQVALQDESKKDEPELDIDEFRRYAKVDDMAELWLDEWDKIGYVYKTFGSGIHLLRLAIRQTESSTSTLQDQSSMFESLVTDLIMRGGDADTNACFAGALVGAYLGYKALPPHWRDGLHHGPWLMQKSEALCRVLGVVPGGYSGKDDGDTAPDGGRGLLTDGQMEEKVMLLQAWMAGEERERRRKEEEAERERESKVKGRWMKWRS